MALDITLLTTKAQCDAALDKLDVVLRTYEHHDANRDYQDWRSDLTRSSIDGRLVGFTAKIASYTATLAQTDLPDNLREEAEAGLEAANFGKSRLTRRKNDHSGAAAFMAAVEAEHLAAYVTLLANAKTLVTAHRATLAA